MNGAQSFRKHQPNGALQPLNSPLEKTPHKAGVIADALMIAEAASFEMAAQDARPAQSDGAYQPELIRG